VNVRRVAVSSTDWLGLSSASRSLFRHDLDPHEIWKKDKRAHTDSCGYDGSKQRGKDVGAIRDKTQHQCSDNGEGRNYATFA